MTKADLHIHTRVSDGMASVSAVLEHIERHTGLGLVAITDHEDAAGGLRARELAAKRAYRFEVLVGAEITTLHGHVVALCVESAPRSFRSVESTIEMIHAQGGLAIVPHPLSWLTRSVSRRTLDRLHARAEPGVTFDAIELANPSPAGLRTVSQAHAHNESTWHLPAVGGSDAHHLLHIGSGWTEFEGTGADALRQALRERTTVARMGRYASLREVGLRQVALGLAWGYAATPRKMLRRPPRRVEHAP